MDVSTKSGLGGTKICFDALINNQIDLYPEYTGTGLLVILKAPPRKVDELIDNKELVYNYVKENFRTQYQVTWLKPIGFNNTYALMMRKTHAKALHVSSISDLVALKN